MMALLDRLVQPDLLDLRAGRAQLAALAPRDRPARLVPLATTARQGQQAQPVPV